MSEPVAARLALACLDLTSLADGDDAAAIERLCAQAVGPAGRGQTAAVCVWPRFVAQARAALPRSIRVAAVANFPAGALDTTLALRDTAAILDAGGDEVDLVLPWHALMAGQAQAAAALVRAVRGECAGRTLKLIIESGELSRSDGPLPSFSTPAGGGPGRSPDQGACGGDALIDAACAIGLDAGVDFLKTSTGKTPHGATPAAAERMLRAIAMHPRRGAVGFKASGGVRTVADAAGYIALVRANLGEAALTPRRLRFGASGLLAAIEAMLDGGAGAAPAANSY